MTVTLPPAIEERVREQVSAGLFANEADLVCGALEQFFAQDELSSWIRQQAALGFTQLDNNQHVDLTREDFMAALSKNRAN
jgi:Arc/MetJ-type ribon-helix-helix transcriptional regulator